VADGYSDYRSAEQIGRFNTAEHDDGTAVPIATTTTKKSVVGPPILPVVVVKIEWWNYKDTNGIIQGPYDAKQMEGWRVAGFFPLNTPVRKVVEGNSGAGGGGFVPIGSVTLCGGGGREEKVEVADTSNGGGGGGADSIRSRIEAIRAERMNTTNTTTTTTTATISKEDEQIGERQVAASGGSNENDEKEDTNDDDDGGLKERIAALKAGTATPAVASSNNGNDDDGRTNDEIKINDDTTTPITEAAESSSTIANNVTMASYPTSNEDGVEEDLAYPEGDDLAYPEGDDLAYPEGDDLAYPEGDDLAYPEGDDLAYPDTNDYNDGDNSNAVVPPPLFDSQDQQNQPKKKSYTGDKAVVRFVPSHLQVRRRQRPGDTAIRRNGIKRRRIVARGASGGAGTKIISTGEPVVVATLNEGEGKVIGDTTSTGGSGVPKASNAVADDYDKFMQEIATLK